MQKGEKQVDSAGWSSLFESPPLHEWRIDGKRLFDLEISLERVYYEPPAPTYAEMGCFNYFVAVTWLPGEDPLEILAVHQGTVYHPTLGMRCSTAVICRPQVGTRSIGRFEGDFGQSLRLAYVSFSSNAPKVVFVTVMLVTIRSDTVDDPASVTRWGPFHIGNSWSPPFNRIGKSPLESYTYEGLKRHFGTFVAGTIVVPIPSRVPLRQKAVGHNYVFLPHQVVSHVGHVFAGAADEGKPLGAPSLAALTKNLEEKHSAGSVVVSLRFLLPCGLIEVRPLLEGTLPYSSAELISGTSSGSERDLSSEASALSYSHKTTPAVVKISPQEAPMGLGLLGGNRSFNVKHGKVARKEAKHGARPPKAFMTRDGSTPAWKQMALPKPPRNEGFLHPQAYLDTRRTDESWNPNPKIPIPPRSDGFYPPRSTCRDIAAYGPKTIKQKKMYGMLKADQHKLRPEIAIGQQAPPIARQARIRVKSVSWVPVDPSLLGAGQATKEGRALMDLSFQGKEDNRAAIVAVWASERNTPSSFYATAQRLSRRVKSKFSLIADTDTSPLSFQTYRHLRDSLVRFNAVFENKILRLLVYPGTEPHAIVVLLLDERPYMEGEINLDASSTTHLRCRQPLSPHVVSHANFQEVPHISTIVHADGSISGCISLRPTAGSKLAVDDSPRVGTLTGHEFGVLEFQATFCPDGSRPANSKDFELLSWETADCRGSAYIRPDISEDLDSEVCGDNFAAPMIGTHGHWTTFVQDRNETLRAEGMNLLKQRMIPLGVVGSSYGRVAGRHKLATKVNTDDPWDPRYVPNVIKSILDESGQETRPVHVVRQEAKQADNKVVVEGTRSGEIKESVPRLAFGSEEPGKQRPPFFKCTPFVGLELETQFLAETSKEDEGDGSNDDDEESSIFHPKDFEAWTTHSRQFVNEMSRTVGAPCPMSDDIILGCELDGLPQGEEHEFTSGTTQTTSPHPDDQRALPPLTRQGSQGHQEATDDTSKFVSIGESCCTISLAKSHWLTNANCTGPFESVPEPQKTLPSPKHLSRYTKAQNAHLSDTTNILTLKPDSNAPIVSVKDTLQRLSKMAIAEAMEVESEPVPTGIPFPGQQAKVEEAPLARFFRVEHQTQADRARRSPPADGDNSLTEHAHHRPSDLGGQWATTHNLEVLNPRVQRLLDTVAVVNGDYHQKWQNDKRKSVSCYLHSPAMQIPSAQLMENRKVHAYPSEPSDHEPNGMNSVTQGMAKERRSQGRKHTHKYPLVESVDVDTAKSWIEGPGIGVLQ
eukprot:GHVN01032427.1.p1 GENE.GHVN01032427.1~~GHVN01032427.1.p1  ORF type:complete len:1270 (-),score=135.69 GHVN01032427.1:1696-5505(-)